MGLHNKFPSYFYKSGNLFNTYLGGGGADSPASRKGRDVPRRARPKPRVVPAVPPAAPNAALGDFLFYYLTPTDKETFVRRVCDADNIAIGLAPNDSRAAREVSGKLPPAKAKLYLDALRMRQARGLPLVR